MYIVLNFMFSRYIVVTIKGETSFKHLHFLQTPQPIESFATFRLVQ